MLLFKQKDDIIAERHEPLPSKLSFFLWERHLAAKPSRRDAAPTKTGLT
jgi:hypothetical protein